MIKTISGLMFSLLISGATLLVTPVFAEQKAIVDVTAIVEHPALDSVRDGIKDELHKAGYMVGKNLTYRYESAQGNPATATQIAKKFAASDADIVIGIATPSAQALVNTIKDKPIVFSAVTDPVGAKIVSSMQAAGKNVVGVSDLSPIDKHMELVKKLVPHVKNLGVVYNAGEDNSVSLVKHIEKYAPAFGMTVKKTSVVKSSDVMQATLNLVGDVEAIYIPTDNTVVSAFEAVVKVANENRIPLIAGDTSSVERGAVAALGFNYYDVGRQTGKLVLRILKGESAGSMNSETVQKTELYINTIAAKKQGVSLDKNMLESAKSVISK